MEKFPQEAQTILDKANATLKRIDDSVNALKAQADGVNGFAASMIVEMLELDLAAGDTVDFKTGTFSRKKQDGTPSE